MMQNIPVNCLIDRTWNYSTKDWSGNMEAGTLIDVSTQTSEDDSDKLIPVGIVLMEDDSFQCVPMEFIFKA